MRERKERKSGRERKESEREGVRKEKQEGGEEENKNRNAKRKRTNKIRNYFNINIQIFFSSPHKTKHVIKWPPQNTSHHPLVLHLTGHQFGKHRSFLFVFWFVTTMTASYVKSYCDQFTDHTNKKVDSRTVWWFTAARFVDRMKREKLQVFFFFCDFFNQWGESGTDAFWSNQMCKCVRWRCCTRPLTFSIVLIGPWGGVCIFILSFNDPWWGDLTQAEKWENVT